MTYYNTLYYKSLSLELTDCDTCKKRHCKYYLCECDKKILEKNYKYNYQIKKHKRQLRCNKAYSNGKGVYCLNGYHDDCDWKVKQYFKIIEARAFQNKELYNKVVEELNKYMLGGGRILLIFVNLLGGDFVKTHALFVNKMAILFPIGIFQLFLIYMIKL